MYIAAGWTWKTELEEEDPTKNKVEYYSENPLRIRRLLFVYLTYFLMVYRLSLPYGCPKAVLCLNVLLYLQIILSFGKVANKY